MTNGCSGPVLFDKWKGQIDAQLPEKGVVVIDHFFDISSFSELLDFVIKTEKNDELEKAGIGKLIDYQVKRSIRGDFISWIAEEEQNQGIILFREWLDVFIKYINQYYFLSIKDKEMHVAMYPEGMFYKKHIDQFKTTSHRQISFVFYLNEDWKATDGGELVVYKNGLKNIVEPVANRMVLFRSDLEHEVLITNCRRYSITGWLLDQPKGLTFL